MGKQNQNKCSLLGKDSVNIFPWQQIRKKTIDALPFICNGEVKIYLNKKRILRKPCFLLEPIRSYITRMTGWLELELREFIESVVEDN
jgi:hypothetical protein